MNPFIAAKAADDQVWSARGAHAEAVALNRADPLASDPVSAVTLQAEFRDRIKAAEQADSELIDIVRDKMLGTRPSDSNHSLLGMVIFEARSRQSLR